MKALLQKLTPVAALFLLAHVHADEAAGKTDSGESKPSATRRQFIRYNYAVIGGNTKKGELYRARIDVFEKDGKLLIRRTRNGKAETVELVPGRDGPEGLPIWNARFTNEKIRVSYVLMFYHDNTPLLVGHVSHEGRDGEPGEEDVETAYPDFTGIIDPGGQPADDTPPKAAQPPK